MKQAKKELLFLKRLTPSRNIRAVPLIITLPQWCKVRVGNAKTLVDCRPLCHGMINKKK